MTLTCCSEVHVYVCLCVCVCVRERERVCVCVCMHAWTDYIYMCVCVCVHSPVSVADSRFARTLLHVFQLFQQNDGPTMGRCRPGPAQSRGRPDHTSFNLSIEMPARPASRVFQPFQEKARQSPSPPARKFSHFCMEILGCTSTPRFSTFPTK